MEGIMKVIVDQQTCIGCGVCASICPKVFTIDDESGKAKVIDNPDLNDSSLIEAIESCPVNAIKKLD